MNAAHFALDGIQSQSDALMRVPGGVGQMCGPQNVVAVVIQENKAKLEHVMEEDGVMGETRNSDIVHVIKSFN